MWYCNYMQAPFYNDDCEPMIYSQKFFLTEDEAWACASKEVRGYILDRLEYLEGDEKEEESRLRDFLAKNDRDIVELWADNKIDYEAWESGWCEVGEVVPTISNKEVK